MGALKKQEKEKELFKKLRINDADYQTKQRAIYNSTLKIIMVGILITLFVGGVFFVCILSLFKELGRL